jgi:hypothetical protein
MVFCFIVISLAELVGSSVETALNGAQIHARPVKRVFNFK